MSIETLRMISVNSEEVRLLRRVTEYASDYFMGVANREFASMNGGLDSLRDRLADAVTLWEKCVSGR